MNQLDLFVVDILDVSLRNDSESMELPMFSLSTKKDTKPRIFENDQIRMTVSPGQDMGHATIFDKDILIYCVSHLMEAKNKGEQISKTVQIVAHDVLKTTKRDTNNLAYTRLRDALSRLAATFVGIHYKSDKKKDLGFHIIDSYEILEEDTKGRMIGIKLTLSDWLYEAIQGNDVLKISPEYFDLRGALDRRLYELARKHCGNQPEWKIGLEKLHAKSGSTAPLKMFKHQLKKRIEAQLIPDYELTILKNDVISATPTIKIGGKKRGHKNVDK